MIKRSKVDICSIRIQFAQIIGGSPHGRMMAKGIACARSFNGSRVEHRGLDHGREGRRHLLEAILREMHMSNPAIAYIVAAFQQSVFRHNPDPAKRGRRRDAGTDAELRDCQAFGR